VYCLLTAQRLSSDRNERIYVSTFYLPGQPTEGETSGETTSEFPRKGKEERVQHLVSYGYSIRLDSRDGDTSRDSAGYG